MREVFQIDGRHQIKSLRECFVTLAWTTGGVIIGSFAIRDIHFNEILTIGLILWLVTSVATVLPFHIQYLTTNWQTKLIIDRELKTLEIIQSGTTLNYKFSDLTVCRHILGHHRPERTKSWTPIPFDYYGYIQIRTNDNKELYVTSLMIDPFNSPLPIDKTEYGFPFIKRPD